MDTGMDMDMDFGCVPVRPVSVYMLIFMFLFMLIFMCEFCHAYFKGQLLGHGHR